MDLEKIIETINEPNGWLKISPSNIKQLNEHCKRLISENEQLRLHGVSNFLKTMNKTITFRDKNHHYENKQEWTDLEWIDEFYKFLQGEVPEKISIGRGYQPKLSDKKAKSIIWYLQEHMRILPDNIEKCDNCKELFDSNSEGIYWETKGKHYCDGCCDLVPYNYDRGKR